MNNFFLDYVETLIAVDTVFPAESIINIRLVIQIYVFFLRYQNYMYTF